MIRLILTLAILAAPDGAVGAAPPKGYELLEIGEGRLRAEVPPWGRSREKPEERKRKLFGALLMAPAEGEGPGMSLALEYYAPGNAYFPDAEAYLARQSAPEAKQEGEAKGWLRDRFKGKLVSKPQSVRANKSKGRRWVRELSQPYPPNTPSAKTFEMKTELVLIEGPKGFYVLSYTAPKNRFLKNRKVFQRALDTFELIPE